MGVNYLLTGAEGRDSVFDTLAGVAGTTVYDEAQADALAAVTAAYSSPEDVVTPLAGRNEYHVDCFFMPKRPRGLLEPCAVKIACTVLRGRERSNAFPLPDQVENGRSWWVAG